MSAKHDFAPLFAHYPSLIADMPAVFTSHQFILHLAQRHQTEYIEALHAYRNTLRDGRPAPFLIVHGILAQQLQACREMVTQLAGYVDSHDIFGDEAGCTQWQKRTG